MQKQQQTKQDHLRKIEFILKSSLTKIKKNILFCFFFGDVKKGVEKRSNHQNRRTGCSNQLAPVVVL